MVCPGSFPYVHKISDTTPLVPLNIPIEIIDLLHDDVKNQNKPGALCIVGFIRGPLSDNIGIFPSMSMFRICYNRENIYTQIDVLVV